MIPLKDRNPTQHFPVVTLLLIAICVVIYFFVQLNGQSGLVTRTADEQVKQITWTVEHAAIPRELTRHRPITAPDVILTFEHGDTTACQGIPVGPPVPPHTHLYPSLLYAK